MILQTDASIKGLGACLLQEGKPIYFTCKALTTAQKEYIAIELEHLVGHGKISSLPLQQPLHIRN